MLLVLKKFGFGSWVDRVVISGTNDVAAPVNCSRVGTLCIQTGGSVTGNNTPTLTLNSGMSSVCTCWGNNSINVGTGADCISTVTIRYKSANTTYNNPKQYIVVSNLTALIDPTCNLVLPLELSTFHGNCEPEFTELFWSTTSRLNSDYFVVEQSQDGLIFEKVCEVDGAGSGFSGSFYSAKAPLDNGNYFRLTRIDFEGIPSTSEIINVACKEAVSDPFPNPFSGNLSVQLNHLNCKNYAISLIDMNGQVVRYFVLKNQTSNSRINLDLSQLARGFYMMEIVNLDTGASIKKSKLCKM